MARKSITVVDIRQPYMNRSIVAVLPSVGQQQHQDCTACARDYERQLDTQATATIRSWAVSAIGQTLSSSKVLCEPKGRWIENRWLDSAREKRSYGPGEAASPSSACVSCRRRWRSLICTRFPRTSISPSVCRCVKVRLTVSSVSPR